MKRFLAAAAGQGEARIRTQDGQEYAVRPVAATASPFDIPGVDLKTFAQEIVVVGAPRGGSDSGMIAVVQRVLRGQVTVEGRVVGRIGAGMVVLAAVEVADTEAEVEWMAGKLLTLRIFRNGEKHFDLDVQQVGEYWGTEEERGGGAKTRNCAIGDEGIGVTAGGGHFAGEQLYGGGGDGEGAAAEFERGGGAGAGAGDV